jgi:catechol 2,3-dioxygenase-like lactoylglutathione lyase family enzyme
VALQHVTLELRQADVPAELGFWALLGFERVEPPPPLHEIAAWAQRDGTQIHLLFTDEPVIANGGHVAVVAEDWDATFARLRGAGFEPDEAARPWGAARAFVRTPGGHLVEFMEQPPVR